MNKTTLLIVIVVLIVLGGLALGGNKIRRTGNFIPVSQTVSPTQTMPPTGATGIQSTPTAGTGYQPGISLTVSSPTNGLEVATPNVTVTGKTAPNAEVFVNDVAAQADANGYFLVALSLDEGENTIIVVANDSDGNVAEQELTVIYNSGT